MMNKFRFAMILSMFFLLCVSTTAYASPRSPLTVFGFTISPGQAFAGETLSFNVGFDFDSGFDNDICFYSNGAGVTYSFPASVTSQEGDTYTNVTGGTHNCSTTGLRAAYRLTSGTAGEFGDSISISVTTGGSVLTTTTHNWRARQYNDVSINSVSTPVRFLVSVSVFVANDAVTCGTNDPCLVGTIALSRAVQYVTSPGVVTVLGAYLFDGSQSALVTGTREVKVVGGPGASVNNSGACSGTMFENNGAGYLEIDSLTLDGYCSSGFRTSAVENTGSDYSYVKTSIVRNFLAPSSVGLVPTTGKMLVEGSDFYNNQTAMSADPGILYAFANDVYSNIGSDAAILVKTDDNVKCNYWGSYTVSGLDAAAQFEKRLGAPVVSYIEGNGDLVLGQASLIGGTGYRVIVSMGRSNPPFNNGTVHGLGAKVSDFYAMCLSEGGTALGDLQITGDYATSYAKFGLFNVPNTGDCTPSDNVLCWDFTGKKGTRALGLTSLENPVEGHYYIGNGEDPTVINLRSASAGTSQNFWLPAGLAVLALGLGLTGLIVSKRQ